MNKLFRADSPLVEVLGKIADMVVLSLLWLLCCLPIVTVVPASGALYRAVYSCVRAEQTHLIHIFWSCFRKDLRSGIGLSLIFSAFTLVNVLWYLFSGNFELYGEGIAYLIISRTLILLELLGVVFLAPLYSSRIMRVVEHLKSTYFLAARNFLITICSIVLLIFSIMLVVIFPPVLIIVPSCSALLHSFLVEPVLKRYTSQNERN